MWKITFPLSLKSNDVAEIIVTLKVCTLLNGVPYGLAFIHYKNYYDHDCSFDGPGVFTDGKIRDGPFTVFFENKFGFSLLQMKNGSTADGGFEYFSSQN